MKSAGTPDLQSLRSLVIVLIIVLFISSNALKRAEAAAGDLDTTFGAGGRVTTTFPGNPGINGLVIQPDGKIVAGGPSGAGFALARYQTNGNLDPTFGTGGQVTTQFPGFLFFATSLARQPNGKLVQAGIAISTTPGGFNFGLARYNEDGSLDTTFGTGGVVSTDFGVGWARPEAVAIQSDGKIVAAGSVSRINDDGTGQDFAIARYNTNGDLDNTFGSSGKVITNVAPFGEGITGIVTTPDNSIVVAGTVRVTMGFAGSRSTLARYLPNGNLDPSFGAGGIVTTDFGVPAYASAIASPRAGTIIVVGGTDRDFALAQYDASGHLDPSFGSGGKVMTDLFGSTDAAYCVALFPNGRIAVGGTSFTGVTFDFAIAQYTASGALDNSFGIGGKTSTHFPGSRADDIRALAVQADGKLVAGGTSVQAFNDVFALARFNESTFDLCLQDDGNGSLFQINSITGDYQFTNCRGLTLGGIGIITRKGAMVALQQIGPDRRVSAQIDVGISKGTASVQLLSAGATFTIADRNMLNSPCSCGGGGIVVH